MKLLHKVVKSSQGLNYLGSVSIDNTIIMRAKPIAVKDEEENSEVDHNEQIISIEVENRLASLERELSEKEKDAFEKINLEKSAIITEALQEAEAIRKEARTAVLVEAESARKQAYQEGLEQGINEAKAQQEKYLRAAATLISEINNNKHSIFIKQENQLIDLAYEIVEKIINQEIKSDKEIIFNIAKQAAKSFRSSDYLKISMAKSDVSQTVVCDENIIRQIAGNIKDVEIELLKEAKEGTIILDNGKEIVDASIPTQLDLLKEIMENSKQPETL